MVILYTYSTCWHMKLMFYEHQHFIITVKCWVQHGCCVQHRLEALHVCIDFFVVFGRWGELIDEHP
jgi:hypothetical protein